ncbi:MAG: flagellar hook assembly protein FlgD [Candidatus Nitrosotenuis sp.]|nr:MAG: flagellar hook assembly protein FlgD [Candidatus Nitrosotenuis sp.]
MIVNSSAETTATPQKAAAGSLLPGGKTASTQGTLSKDQFLKLLIEQLKHQDPLSPMQNTEFTSQMAQFSQLEQLYNVNTNLGTMAQASVSANNAQALSLIGKEVIAAGNSVDVSNGAASDLSFKLPENASDTSITVSDAKGNVVATIDAGAKASGDNTVTWDGRDAAGQPVASGTYTFSVNAHNLAGDSISANTYMKGIVKSVSIQNGVSYLNLGNNTKIQLGDVMEVSQPGTATASAAVKNLGIFPF